MIKNCIICNNELAEMYECSRDYDVQYVCLGDHIFSIAYKDCDVQYISLSLDKKHYISFSFYWKDIYYNGVSSGIWFEPDLNDYQSIVTKMKRYLLLQ